MRCSWFYQKKKRYYLERRNRTRWLCLPCSAKLQLCNFSSLLKPPCSHRGTQRSNKVRFAVLNQLPQQWLSWVNHWEGRAEWPEPQNKHSLPPEKPFVRSCGRFSAKTVPALLPLQWQWALDDCNYSSHFFYISYWYKLCYIRLSLNSHLHVALFLKYKAEFKFWKSKFKKQNQNETIPSLQERER